MGVSKQKQRSRKRIKTFRFTRTTKHKLQVIEWLFGPIDPSKYKDCSFCLYEGTGWCRECIDYDRYEL